MNIDIITCLPELLESFFSYSIIKRAINKKIINLIVHNLHDYSNNKHKKTDDYAYGGIPGLVMKIEPVDICISTLKKKTNYDEIIYMSPDGNMLNQNIANELSLKNNIIILCGHYKGIDERIRNNLITREISIGEYVLTGGELPACVLVDSIVRLIPGVLNNSCSALEDSFQNGMISPPVYTRPKVYNGIKVPEVLLSGNKKKIQEWLLKEMEIKTKQYLKKKNKNKTS